MADLTPRQMKLLRGLAEHGGVLVVRARGRPDYRLLEKAGCITSCAVSETEIRHEITDAGRAAVRTKSE